MKPLRIDTSRMQMMGKGLWNCACGVCDKLQAKWEMRSPPEGAGTAETVKPICSLCFLYESKWGKDRLDQINGYLTEVMSVKDAKALSKMDPLEQAAQSQTRKMVLGPAGQLTNITDADFILGILALTSRRFDIEDQKLGAG